MNDLYFKTNKNRQEYIGERYFRFNYTQSRAVQVCVSGGQLRRGRSNTPGIYFITSVTFLSNYLGMGYVGPCTKTTFNKKMEEIYQVMKAE